MINVNQITAQLAQMSDEALQQFAQQRKKYDPYSVALALSESNRRKQMRTASQMPQGGEPPKVVDQELAQMAAPQTAQAMPEDTGIGALPAGDMNFADGGIVGFADGGVPGYAAELGAPLVRMPNESFADFRRRTFDAELRRQQAANAAEAQAREAERVRRVAARGEAGTIPPSPFFDRAPFAALTPSGVSAPAVSDVYPSETMRGAATMPPPEMTAPTQTPAPPGPPAPSARDKALPETEEGITQLLAPRAPGAAATGPTGFAAQFKAARDAAREPDPYAAETEALGKEMVASKEAGLAGIKARQEATADIFKGKEANIASRSADILRRENANVGLAWLNAGLAIMSTPGGLATAIGKGARVGTEQFAAGLDKINAAKDKLAEAQERLEELKINRSEMSAKEIQDAETGIREAKITARGLGLQGLKDAGARNEKAAGQIFDATTREALTRMQLSSAAGIAKMQAARAIMSDARADARERLSAARELSKNAQNTIKDVNASEADRTAAQTDLATANTVLRGLGGIEDISDQDKSAVAKYLNLVKPPKK